MAHDGEANPNLSNRQVDNLRRAVNACDVNVASDPFIASVVDELMQKMAAMQVEEPMNQTASLTLEPSQANAEEFALGECDPFPTVTTAKYHLMVHLMDVLQPLPTAVEPNPQRKYQGDTRLRYDFANSKEFDKGETKTNDNWWVYGQTKELVRKFDDAVLAVYRAPPANFNETTFEKGTRRLPHNSLMFAIVLKLGDFPARDQDAWNDFRDRLFCFFRKSLIEMTKHARLCFANYTSASRVAKGKREIKTLKDMKKAEEIRFHQMQREDLEAEDEVCCHFILKLLRH